MSLLSCGLCLPVILFSCSCSWWYISTLNTRKRVSTQCLEEAQTTWKPTFTALFARLKACSAHFGDALVSGQCDKLLLLLQCLNTAVIHFRKSLQIHIKIKNTTKKTCRNPYTWVQTKAALWLCALALLCRQACARTGRRWCVCKCINQILTVRERDRGHGSAAFRRLSLYLLWQFPRCTGPPGHCVCLCLSFFPEIRPK